MTYTIVVCTMKTPDDGQRNCPKHVEFNSKNKFEKTMQLVGFVLRIESRRCSTSYELVGQGFKSLWGQGITLLQKSPNSF